MRIFLVSLGILLLFGCVSSKLYIVRHAERGDTPPGNPHLSEAGKSRANELALILHNKRIHQIYATPYNRTVETATPLSKRINLPVQLYSNDTLTKLLLRVVQSQNNTLIVGHSNTILRMLDELQIPHDNVHTIPDNKFDYLFIVRIRFKSPIGFTYKLKVTTYGKTSPARGDTTRTFLMDGD